MRNARQKSKMAATKFRGFFVISTSDRGDFPRIIVIALLFYFIFFYYYCQELKFFKSRQLHNIHDKSADEQMPLLDVKVWMREKEVGTRNTQIEPKELAIRKKQQPCMRYIGRK